MTNKKTVVFLQRKPRKYGNFSVEFIFRAVRENLPDLFEGVDYPAKYESKGLWKRLYIALDAAFHQADVNHVTGDVHFLTYFLSKGRTILTVLDVGFMEKTSIVSKAILKFFWITLPLKKCAFVTTISEATKQELLKYSNFPSDKIEVIYVPISDDFIPNAKEFNKIKPIILQLGVAFNKNIDRLIEAVRDINCHLEIVGKLPEPLQKKLEKYQISYTLSWNLTDEEVRQKYIDCDIVSLISTYEGFGMPIVEGNATGRAVITSNILSMPEVAGDAAHLVDPFNVEEMRKGFLKIINDDDYRNQMILNGFENRKRFSLKKIVKEYVQIYDRIGKR